MTVTATYSRAHRAFLDVAREHGIHATEVRVLVALRDLGGEADSRTLTAVLALHSQAVRRALIRLMQRGLVDETDFESGVYMHSWKGWQIANEAVGRCKAVAA